MNKAFLLALVQYMASYEKSETCFVTAGDESIFHNKANADSHAESLKDDTVVEFTRDHVAELAQKHNVAIPEDKEGYTSMTNGELRKLLADKKISVAKNISKKADLIALLKGEAPAADAEEEQEKSIDDMTVADLQAFLTDNDVEFKKDDKKADLLELAKAVEITEE